MKFKTRPIALILAALLTVSMIAGCGSKDSSSSGSDSIEKEETKQEGTAQESTEEEVELLDGGVTYPTGLPITKEVIELDADVLGLAWLPDIDTTAVWDWVEEQTNIRVNVNVLSDNEKVQLVFAGREYPDILMKVDINDKQLNDAAEAGDLVEIGPMLEEYAPTWKKFYDEHPAAYKRSLAADGKLYSLPYVDYNPTEKGIRDVQWINKTWLDELNLDVPTTTEEFKNVLLEFKNNAGKGSIPEDVWPYAFVFDSYVSGQFDIFGAFGVYTPTADYMIVQDGVVSNQAINPEIKEPLKYLNELYELGLILPEAFTISFDTFTTRVVSENSGIGAYCAFNKEISDYTPYGPLDAENGKVSLIRSQEQMPNPMRAGIITKENPYPIATLRLFEWLTDPEVSWTVTEGLPGVWWNYDEEGKILPVAMTPEESDANQDTYGVHNTWVALKDENFYKNNYNATGSMVDYFREWAYYNLYDGKTTEQDWIFKAGTLEEEENNEMSLLATDISNCRKAWFADFITGKKDIDADWDTYVAEMENLGHDRLMELRQKAYDLVH